MEDRANERQSDHDAVLRVFDATDRLEKKLIGWKWSDGRPTRPHG